MSMFDVQQQIENEMLSNAKDVANLPLGRAGLYSASVQGDMYNQGLMSLAGLMGGSPDPRIAKEQALQSIFEEYGNPETPEEAVAVADALLAKGFNAEAQQFMNFSVELRNSMPKPDKPATAIQLFNEAVRGGYTGTIFEYQRDLKAAGASSTTMLPTPAKGFQYEQDENGNWVAKIIPGGSAAIEIEEKETKAIMTEVLKQRGADVVLTNINQVLDSIDNPTTILGFDVSVVGWGSLLKDIPGTPAKGVKGMIDTIRGNIGFDKLQAMRDASPTGGALGQVSELELQLLMSTLGSLDQAQNAEDVKRVLNQIKIQYNYIVHGSPGVEVPEDLDPAEVG